MRIPRKKKKYYKKIWKQSRGYDCKIRRSTIKQVDKIWGCVTYRDS